MVINICGPAQQRIPSFTLILHRTPLDSCSPKREVITSGGPRHTIPKIPTIFPKYPYSVAVHLKNSFVFTQVIIGKYGKTKSVLSWEWVSKCERERRSFFKKAFWRILGLSLSLSFLNLFTSKSISLMVDLTHWVESFTKPKRVRDRQQCWTDFSAEALPPNGFFSPFNKIFTHFFFSLYYI